MLSTVALAAALNITTAYIPLPGSAQQLAVHCVQPARPGRAAVLFIHGASFPTRLASGYQFSAGDSWLHLVASQGYLACGVDFPGFGESSKPPALLDSRDASVPLLRAPEAARAIASSVDYLRTKPGISSVHVVAHSWGTIPALTFAAQHDDQIASLTLFGPIVPLEATEESSKPTAWFALDVHDRLDQLRFKELLPAGAILLDPEVNERWAREFARSGQHVGNDASDIVRVPSGPIADIEAAESGEYPFDPKNVRTSLFVVYGSFDSVVNDNTAAKFIERFTAAPLKWRLRIDDGTHVMHLERHRHSLYEAVLAFIRTNERGA
jgi:pimeloyl-ACP methyl ester carboxylesterase